MRTPITRSWVAGLLALPLLMACSNDDDLVVFQFQQRGDSTGEQDFRAAARDPELIAAVREELAKPVAERRRHIHGDVEPGDDGVNSGWSWHFVTDDWSLEEISIELCDTTPNMIEDDVEEWSKASSGACHWGSYVVGEVPEDER